MNKAVFYLWSGSGYVLDGPFTVESELLTKWNYFEYGIELLTAQLIEKELTDYYLTDEQYTELCKELEYNPDDNFGDDLEGWLYVDATMEGALYPVYLRIENLKCEFVPDEK